MIDETTETDETPITELDEVYRAVLPALDQLPREDQCTVALNWVKYVLSGAAHGAVGSKPLDLMTELVNLCESFALQVMQLPTHYAKAAVEVAEQIMKAAEQGDEGGGGSIPECSCVLCLARKKRGSN